jgi:FkbM family methyltransferase
MSNRLKEIIKKIIPPSRYTFNRRMERVEKNVGAVNGHLDEHIAKIDKRLAYMGKSFSNLERQTPKKVLYNNDFERTVIRSFYDVTESDDFKEKFLALIKDLDPQSIETVTRILRRQQLIKGTEGRNLDIWTREEQKRIKELEEAFESLKFKVADDLYCYKNYLLPVNHFEASVFYDRHGLALVEGLDSVQDKDIIDVGGFIGDSVLIFAPLTNKNVYSFESIMENYKIMLQTIELNHIKNAVAEKLALGAALGTITMNVSGSCSGVETPLGTEVFYQETVDVIPLDDYVDAHQLNVGLIKVDIEGFEQEFLKGAEKTIKEQKPILLLSIYHNVDDFFSIKPMIEGWGLGYKFKIHKPKDYTVSREVLLLAEIR